MDILSAVFFVFTFTAVILYWICPKKIRWSVLLCSNIVFVWYANHFSRRAFAVMFFLILVAYAAGRLFERFATNIKLKKLILICALISEAGLLIVLKDMKFFQRYFPFDVTVFQFIHLVAPLGISYFTLSLIGYILDTYWGGQNRKEPLPFFSVWELFSVIDFRPYHKICDNR